MSLEIKSPETCQYACVSLGEVMLRLDPGDGRVHTARQFNAWEGGGEYNVTRGLRRCFGLKAAVVTALADNPVGRLIEDFILQGGVDTDFIQWKDYDGIGRSVRNGLNFTEKGYGIRGARGTPDRGHTAASQIKAGDVDWHHLFGKLGVQWFHTGGIFAALSDTTPETVIEAVKIAKEYGTIVSYDLNYRPSLWKDFGGLEKCQEVNREIAKYVDVMIGNEEDFSTCLGFEVEGTDENLTHIEEASFKRMIEQAVKEFPNFKATATTLRNAKTATLNEWSALVWHEGQFFEPIRKFQGDQILEIYDRVGGGDSFASGLIYGFLQHNDPLQAVSYGCIHGALAMTTPGDTTMASLQEVEKLLGGGGARVDR
ncbi:MAG: PfkB family carbohydrate kinase [Coraliomargaritaceae bacterium]